MNIDKLRIIIDEREKKSGIPDLLKAVGMKIELKTLAIGDYIVAPETIIERKSIQDFVSSIFDGRLFDQCSRLKEHFENPIILLEGNVDEIEEITENPLVFYGAISTIVIDFKIPIIPTPNASHTAKLLVSMSSRKESTKGPFLKKIRKSNDLQRQQLSTLCSLPGVFSPTPGRLHNLQRQQLSTLCSLPGVGEKTATRMLAKFGSPLKVFSASSVELAKIEGLGGARAKKIKKMLESKSHHLKKSNQKTLHD